MKKIAVLFFLILFHHCLMAQEDMRQKVSLELKKLAEKYKQPGTVSFDILYRYAAENKPLEILDSLSGSFKIHGQQYWYRLAETEAAGNSNILMMLFKEDGVMYLSKPHSSALHSNPLALIDSLATDKQIAGCNMITRNGSIQIILSCRPGMAYKKIEYDIDVKTGLLSKMISTVQAKQLYDPSVKDKVSEGTFAIIEASFTNYNQGKFDEKDFDLTRYFKKQGNDFVTVPPYDSYKIFLGSPNL
jgi:hypothetical protein